MTGHRYGGKTIQVNIKLYSYQINAYILMRKMKCSHKIFTLKKLRSIKSGPGFCDGNLKVPRRGGMTAEYYN